MARFLDTVSVEVAAMFRDPYFHKAFRERVVPGLKARPLVRVWHAGCATGEEVYSLAILLHEEGLLEKAKLYATGLNAWALERGKDGIFPMKRAQEYTSNYQRAGGRGAFSDYCTAKHDAVIMRDLLRKNIVWAEHKELAA
jgi:chemotaxis protein methyltransferase CheR